MLKGGLYRVTTHKGLDARTFLTVENPYGISRQSIMYEVKGSNHLKMIFNTKQVITERTAAVAKGADKYITGINSFFNRVECGKNARPMMLEYDFKDKKMILHDVLKILPGSEVSNEREFWTGRMPDEIAEPYASADKSKFKSYFTPSMINGVVVSSCLDSLNNYREVLF